MSNQIVDGIPVSPFCEYAIKSNKQAARLGMFLVAVFAVVAWFALPTFYAVVLILVGAVVVIRMRPVFKRTENLWFKINKKDHAVAEELENILRVLYYYSEKDIQNAGVEESQLGSLWTPVYAQYFSGERSLSANVSVSGYMSGLFTSAGELSGKVTGSVSPDSMADLGAVLILQNEQGRSIRVVVPHRKVARQMLETVLSTFTKDEITFKTLTSLQLLRMSMLLPAKACVTFASALRILDQVVAICGKPLAERSMVKVYGNEVSPGVILATALEIEGECGIFIPTGYIKEVTDKLSEFLGPYRGDVGLLLDGQGPFAEKTAEPSS